MGLKGSERMQKYLATLDLPGNEELKRKYLERKRKNERNYRQRKLNSSNAEKFKKKRSQQSKESRGNRYLREINQNQDPNSNYKTKQGLNKAVKRLIRSLPKEKAKKVEAMHVAAEILDFKLEGQKTMQKVSRQRHYFHTTPELVKSFYLLDSTSRQLPGKKDVITLKSDTGKKEQFQKRVMLTSIEEAYNEFIGLYPDHPICKSKFFDLRPRYVLLISQIPQNVCCCIYCSNFEFLFEALKPYLTEVIANVSDFHKKFICGQYFDCAADVCGVCADFDERLKEILVSDCENEAVNWKKWIKKDKFVQKYSMENSNVSDVLKEFKDSFSKYKIHRYLVRVQHGIINEIKSNNSDQSVILQMDFSENFAITSQDEVQSAHFAQRQLTIFTAFALVGQFDQISFAIVNDDTKHMKEQVTYYIKLIIDLLRGIYEHLNTIHFVSDGSAAQFKNKYILSNLVHMEADYGLKVKWHFLPTAHGKSNADGIGGILKRQVTHRILTGQYEIHSAKDFAECANSFVKNINVIVASAAEMETATESLKQRWINVSPIPGTQSFHYFEPIGDNILAAISSKLDGVQLFHVN